MLFISNRIRIYDDELEFTFVRSSGPGGQNVNKVASKAVLRWRPSSSTGIDAKVLERFLEKFSTRITNSGDLIITSDSYRDQLRNQNDCLRKLQAMLLTVADDPKPRIKTKITYGTKMQNMATKRIHGERKRLRKKPSIDD